MALLPIKFEHPWWQAIRSDLLTALAFDEPRARLDWLNKQAHARVCRNGRGLSIEFIDQAHWSGRAYEAWIDQHGQVPTRLAGKGQWHDLFNALIWLSCPLSKAQLNRAHAQALRTDAPGSLAQAGRRGPMRDKATLIDEQALIWLAIDPVLRDALQNRDWSTLFVKERDRWFGQRQTQSLFVFGHALYEKFLAPYKALTAHVLILSPAATSSELKAQSKTGCLDVRHLDAWLAARLSDWIDAQIRQQPHDRGPFAHPACGEAAQARSLQASPAATLQLYPLPVLGVPGWHQDNACPAFYDDCHVFRGPVNS